MGAVDGKHVRITPPAGSGSYYWNYKGYNSLVLMGIANANYELIMVHFGINGRISDGGVIEYTEFYQKLKHNELNIPTPSKPNCSSTILPYVFLGDEAFTLREDFLKPFGQGQLNIERKIYNYRLSRARRVIENVFGILANRFRVFHTSINLKLERIDKVVMACCTLHNFLCRKRQQQYIFSGSVDQENIEDGTIELGERPLPNTLTDLEIGHSRNSRQNSKDVRDLYVDYFSNDGVVSWQNKFI